MKRKLKTTDLTKDRRWKEKDYNYLRELQFFFDKADNIDDNELKSHIISQMLRCDKILTEKAEEMFIQYYKMGYKDAKNG